MPTVSSSLRRVEREMRKLDTFYNKTVRTIAETHQTRTVHWDPVIAAEGQAAAVVAPGVAVAPAPSILRRHHAGPVSYAQAHRDDAEAETLGHQEALVIASGQKWKFATKARHVTADTYRLYLKERSRLVDEFGNVISPTYDTIDLVTRPDLTAAERVRYMAFMPQGPPPAPPVAVLSARRVGVQFTAAATHQAATIVTTRRGRQIRSPDRLTYW